VKKILLTTLALCFLAGCHTSTSQRVGLAGEAYITTTNSMTVLSRTGDLDIDKAEVFESFRAPVKQYLDIAYEDLLDGDGDDSTADNALDILIPILDAMIEANREAQNNE